MTFAQQSAAAVQAPWPAPGPDATARSYLAVADAIGCALVRDAIWSGDRCNWLGWSLVPDATGTFVPVVRALTPELYGGVTGIALFLARLQAVTGDPQQARTLRGALRQVEVAIMALHPKPSGLYSGVLGTAWALIQIGQALEDEDTVDRGLARMEEASREAEPPGLFDLLNGTAGHALGLVAAAVAYDRDDLMAAAIAAAERLVAAGRWTNAGLSWPSSPDHGDLLGLSHGTSGAALALFEVAAAAGRADLREAARAGLRYERRHFDPQRQAWPDFRAMPGAATGQPSFPFAWCHGGIGIGLSRLRIREVEPDDPLLASEIDCALAAGTRRLGAGLARTEDFSLCHGTTGLGELLIETATRIGRPEALDGARRIGDQGIAWFHAHRTPWRCGVAGAGETPSLMLGTAGIGLHYMRLDDPASAPSVLLPTATSLRPTASVAPGSGRA